MLREYQNAAAPGFRVVLIHHGWALLHQQKHAEAEETLRDAVPFFDLPSRPEGSIRYNWEGLFGASLVAQKKYAEAEPRLLNSYRGRVSPVARDESPDSVVLFTKEEAVQWLVRLYDEWGKPDEAAKWRTTVTDGNEVATR
jgi:hypothetical protein